jgi:transcriptional regulator with XRE-family HTH domain
MRTALQRGIDEQREVYDHLAKPLLAQLAVIHGLTVRDVSQIFGISKSHAAEILSHKKVPSLEVSFRLARYFEVTVDDLFGWMLDDDGNRRPLVVLVGGKLIRLKSQDRSHDALALVKQVAEAMRERGRR